MLKVSIRTLARWEGEKLRSMRLKGGAREPAVYLHRADVDRLRHDRRIGPARHELEARVLEGLANNASPMQIVASAQVTLADIESIRAHEARLRDAFVLDGEHARSLRDLLELERVDGPSLVERVRELVARVERLAGELAVLRPKAPSAVAR